MTIGHIWHVAHINKFKKCVFIHMQYNWLCNYYRCNDLVKVNAMLLAALPVHVAMHSCK